MTKTLLILIINLQVFVLYSQSNFYLCAENSEVIKTQNESCSTDIIGNFSGYIDIAITPNGNLYGIGEYLFHINTINLIETPIGQSNAIDGVYSAGLVALNNDFLLLDRGDSLFKIDVNNGDKTFLGIIGYFCAGDFAFFNNELYMVSELNELIRISLDPISLQITDVNNIGIMNTLLGTVYALFTSYDNCNLSKKHLYAIDKNIVYEVNIENAQTIEVCQLNTELNAFGATSLADFDNTVDNVSVPNVITPNNDGINDYFELKASFNLESFYIINRWGNVVYSWDSGNIYWNGKNQNGDDLSSGVYYFIGTFKDCPKMDKLQGFITIIR